MSKFQEARGRLQAIGQEIDDHEAIVARLYAKGTRSSVEDEELMAHRVSLMNLRDEQDILCKRHGFGDYTDRSTRLKSWNIRANRPYTPAELGEGSSYDGGGYQSAEDREAEHLFIDWMRTGDAVMQSELRSYNDVDMVVGVEGEGGAAVPTGLVRKIKARRDESMLAPLLGCEKVDGVGTTINYPIDAEADVLFSAVSEASSVDQDSPVLSSVALTLATYAKYTTLSWQLIRDESAALNSFLMGWLARGWSSTHNNLLVTAALAGGTASLTADASDAIGAAEVAEIAGKLPSPYRKGAQWLMSSTTFSYLQGLSSSSQFLFAPTPGGDPMGKLWGYPLHESGDMPDYGASAKSLLIGNFAYGMAYRDPEQLVIIRDPYSAATTGQVRIHAHFSACYAVTMAPSLVYMTHPSA